MQAGYYRQPTIHGETIVFVSEDDLWSVPANGGIARRLTANPGRVTFPVFDPDGERLAFISTDDGPQEVYVMDASGGKPERRTWLGGPARTVGWSADGKSVVFQSADGQPFRSLFHLHEVPAADGHVKRLPFGPAREIARAPAGKGVVLAINSGDPAKWKRYRGGTAGTLWIDRDGKGGFEPLIELEGNLAGPMWIGRRIYFLSDHEGHGNLYSCTQTGRALRRHTDHESFYVRFPLTDGRRIVYHAGADLFLFDPKSDEERPVEVALRSPRAGRQRRFVDASEYLESADLHPKGHTLACVTRGSVHTLPLWTGAPAPFGRGSDTRYRLARWLRAGKRLIAVSDVDGEESLVVFREDGEGRVKRIRRDLGRVVDLSVAPAGAERVAIANHRQEVRIVDLRTGRDRLVEASEYYPIGGMAWSPDGRWLAYGIHVGRHSAAIHLFDTDKGTVHAATSGDFVDHGPSFDPRGKYLYFLSHRVFDPVYDNQYFDLGFPRAVRPHLICLARGTSSPFSAVAGEPRPPRGAEEDDDKKKKPKKTTIDLRGIIERVVAFPVEEARYNRIGGADGRVYFSSTPVEGALDKNWTDTEPTAKKWLETYDFSTEKTDVIIDGVTDFALTPDGKCLLVRVGNRLRVLDAAIEKKEVSGKDEPGRESGWTDLDRLRVTVEPGEEWRQMFREAWRLQRDHFWTPDLSRVDWNAVYDRYLPLVDRVGSRSEFSDLIWEMQGELGTSHCYELGGDYRPSPEWFQGFLGADLAWDSRARRWRIRRIPRGDPWIRHASSPLSAPGAGIIEGDAIVAVDGCPTGADQSPFQCLVNQADRDIVLTIESRGKRRRVGIRTLGNDRPLRYRDWVEANRSRVHDATKGRVGYIHMPDMGPHGFSEFHRYYQSEVYRDGLIIDVRWNGGGHVSQLLLEKLQRRRLGYDQSRWMGVSSYPEEAPTGAMVAITNEYAGSDGDMFCHAFKMLGLGPLIGKRTWGGVVGIWPRHALVDGTITTQPEFGFWFSDVGFGVENYGTDPDIEVTITPSDHAAGRDTQLDRALKEIGAILRESPRAPPKMGKPPQLGPPPKLPNR